MGFVKKVLGFLFLAATLAYLVAFASLFFRFALPEAIAPLLTGAQEQYWMYGAALGCFCGSFRTWMDADILLLGAAVFAVLVGGAADLIPGGLATAVQEENVAGVVTFVFFLGFLGYAFAAMRTLRSPKEKEAEH